MARSPLVPRHALPTLLALGVALTGIAVPAEPVRGAEAAPGRYIVVLKEGTDVRSAIQGDGGRPGLQQRLAIRPTHTYAHALRGFAAALDADQVRALEADPSVALVAPDLEVTLEDQQTPAGIRRVKAPQSPAAKIDGVDKHPDRVDADVAVIDTGVQGDHPDLNVVGGVNCAPNSEGIVDPTKWGDVDGHGTHVAGTIGALDDTQGVVGVAPGARIWSVRVFDWTAKGYLSWIICGVDWVTAQRDPADPSKPLIEVANMSLSTPGSDDNACGTTNDDLEHQAICRAVAAGTTYVVAAGNQSTWASTRVPAAYDEVMTVGAIADFDGLPGGLGKSPCYSWGGYDTDDTYADFSNYGKDVDLMAPGKCVWSTYPGSTYKFLSGTSMATPTVAGGAALYKATHPEASPAEVQAALVAGGNHDWDTATERDSYRTRLMNVETFGGGAGFTLWLDRQDGAVGASGGTATYTVQVARGDGNGEDIALSVSGLPAGATAAFANPVLSGLAAINTTLGVTVPAGTTSGVYPLTIKGAGSGQEGENAAEGSLTVDGTAPVVTAPVGRITTGSTLRETAVPVNVRWSARDEGTGLSKLELRLSKDGGEWRTVDTFAPATTSSVRWLTPGHRYRYQIRATDVAGNTGDSAIGSTLAPVARQSSSSAIRYSGAGWKNAYVTSAYGGGTKYASSSGHRATFTFTGRQVAWIAPQNYTRGKADVYVDGLRVATVDLYRSSYAPRRVVFSRAWAQSGTHTLEIRVLGTPSGRPRVDIDAFIVLR